MSVKVLQCHKRASYEYKYIQDKYAISSDRKVFALADGTTQSFNSEIWADIITKQFVKAPSFLPGECIQTFKNCVNQYRNSKFDFSANPAKASLERSKQSKGGTATFIGLRFLPDNHIELLSCGDSNFFLFSSSSNFIGYPFSDLDSLDANIRFINTEALIQEKVDEAYFSVNSFTYRFGDILILATDALSRLLINRPDIFEELLKIESFEQLNEFCEKHWNNRELQEDDVSAIIISIDNRNTKKLIIPPIEFSFPREKEEVFIPASLIQDDNQVKFTDMQMNEIRNEFNGIANDLGQVRKRQKRIEMLMIATVSFALFSFLYVVFFRDIPISENSVGEIHNQKEPDEKHNNIKTRQGELDKPERQLQFPKNVRNEMESIQENDTNTVVNKP